MNQTTEGLEERFNKEFVDELNGKKFLNLGAIANHEKILAFIQNELSQQLIHLREKVELELCLLGNTNDPKKAVKNIKDSMFGKDPVNLFPSVKLGKAEALSDILSLIEEEQK